MKIKQILIISIFIIVLLGALAIQKQNIIRKIQIDNINGNGVTLNIDGQLYSYE